MIRHVQGLLLWLVFVPTPSLAAAAAPATMPVAITFTEQPIQLVRDTTIYKAARGAALQADDLIASGSGTILLDANGATIALGPESAVFIRNGALVLLKGWLKIDGSSSRPLLLTTPGIQFDSTGIAATLHVTPGSTEIFAESAPITVLELSAGKAPRRITLQREQFGVRSGTLPVKLAPRPPSAFLAGMPRTFLDPLVPLAAKGPAVAPKRDRPATFAELAPLLADQKGTRQQLQTRFAPPPSPPRLQRAVTPPAQRHPDNLF